MTTYVGYTRSGTAAHLAQPRRVWYSGMTEAALCGARVNVSNRVAGSAPGHVQPVGTCRRCAKALGQTVRTAS